MEASDAIKRLTLSSNPDQAKSLNYLAEMVFPVSFGNLTFTFGGTLDIETDPPQSVINNTILNAAIEDLKATPKIFESVLRYMAWESAGKPPYAEWCMANYPIR